MASELSKTAHPLYRTWARMKERCYNSNHQAYPRYGGRGISVCARWRNEFWKFVEDMGDRPEGCTLDRINNNGNYEPSNCRWATRSQQQRNKQARGYYWIAGRNKWMACFAGKMLGRYNTEAEAREAYNNARQRSQT